MNNKLNTDVLETILSNQDFSFGLSRFIDMKNQLFTSYDKQVIAKVKSLESMEIEFEKNSTKHIVVVGAGFAGLKLARTLNNHPSYKITLIDKNNYHQFQPLFYQVAMANLDASNISFPLRNIFQKSKNVTIRVADVTRIISKENRIETSHENFTYDYLVIASGAKTNYFGNLEIERQTFSMKSTFEALQIRNSLLQHFEDALTANSASAKSLLSIVIVGGGPTGVELSGALAEMKSDSLKLEYPELDFTKMNIYLLEGSSRLLSAMSEASSQKAKEYLQKLGVTVMLNSIVKDYNGMRILLQDSNVIESTFVIWAAGVSGNIPKGLNPDFISRSNQIKTDNCNLVISTDNVFALGDVALMESELYPKGYPQLASVAIDQSKNLANNFVRISNGKPMIPFQYVNKGSMATVGRNKAIVDLVEPKLSFHGFTAWLIWMTLHLFLLIGFKNRLIVFINWIYKYVTHKQSLALLFPQLTKRK